MTVILLIIGLIFLLIVGIILLINYTLFEVEPKNNKEFWEDFNRYE